MWWLKGAALAAALLSAACGFKPLYGTDGAPAAELAAIVVDPIPDRLGQQLRTHLEILLDPRGAGAPERYRLNIRLDVESDDVAIRRDETATRRDLSMAATYVLTDLSDGSVATRGRATTVNSYNVVASDVATRAGERDSLEAGVRRLAEDIKLRLAIFMDRRQSSAGTS